jgi:putative Holliday junction resolvase
VLAIDHGEKRTGFAVADPLRVAVHPLTTWHGHGHGKELLDHIESLLEERDVDTFLIGFPFHMDGTCGERAQQVRRFASSLAARFPAVRIVLQDERLSTKEAEDLMSKAGLDYRERKRERDSWSATVFLRDWIAAGEPS